MSGVFSAALGLSFLSRKAHSNGNLEVAPVLVPQIAERESGNAKRQRASPTGGRGAHETKLWEIGYLDPRQNSSR